MTKNPVSTFPLHIQVLRFRYPCIILESNHFSVRKDRPRHQRDHRHLWSAARRMGRFFNFQAGQPIQCTLCVSLNSIRLLNVRYIGYSTKVVAHLPVPFVRVMLLEVDISLAAFSLYLPTVSRRPHPRWRPAQSCVIGLFLTQVLHVHETRPNTHHFDRTWPQCHKELKFQTHVFVISYALVRHIVC